MSWKVVLSKRAKKQLAKLDPNQRAIILLWLKKNVDGCANPRQSGKPLADEFAGQWRYRVGDYRIICEIRDDELVVLALNIIHRSRAYRR